MTTAPVPVASQCPVLRRVPAAALVSVTLVCSLNSAAAQSTRPAGPNRDQLDYVCSNKIERYLTYAQVAYRCTPEQIDRVRSRFEELRPQQIRYSLETMSERAQLAKETVGLLPQVTPTSQPAEYAEKMARIRRMNEGNVIFHEARALQEIEALLPSDQARQGRERYEAGQRQVAGRMAAGMALDVFGRHLNAGKGSHLAVETVDGWERFVRTFCDLFEFNSGQRATAESLLGDILAMRDQYMDEHREEIDFVLKGRGEGPAGLLAPVEALWEELRGRLDLIPTREQLAAIKAARPNVPATRPTDHALLSSRLAAPKPKPQSRPAGMPALVK